MNNVSAFPTNASNYGHFPSSAYSNSESGMTLRDYFAGQVLAGMWSGRFPDDICQPTVERVAKGAYSIADAMLAERIKDETNPGT